MQKNEHNDENNIVGDCLRACICSILEISDEGIYNFVEDENYPEILEKFLLERNIWLYSSKEKPKDIEYYMVWGVSPRGVQHSVIYSKGKLVHDPHPKGGGVIPDTYAWIEELA